MSGKATSYYVLRKPEGEAWRVVGQHLDSRKAHDELERRRGQDPGPTYRMAPKDLMRSDQACPRTARLGARNLT